jgi:hypothetical protein
MNFPGIKLTRNGEALMASLVGGGELVFTTVRTGSGAIPNDFFSASVADETVTVTNDVNGAATAVDVDTGFTVTVTQEGTEALPQIVDIDCLAGASCVAGSYFTISIPGLSFYAWVSLDGSGDDPGLKDHINIGEIAVLSTDTDDEVAVKVAAVFNDYVFDVTHLYELIAEEQSLAVTSAQQIGESNIAEIATVLTNTGLGAGYQFVELGIFAMDGENEILYAITNAGNDAALFPAQSSATLIEMDLKLRMVISSAATININITAEAYASLLQFTDHLTDPDAHLNSRDMVLEVVDTPVEKYRLVAVKGALAMQLQEEV